MTAETCILDEEIPNKLELEKALALLTRWGHITGPQYAALIRELEPHLPCLVMIEMKTKKGRVRVITAKPSGIARFSLDNRAKLIGQAN